MKKGWVQVSFLACRHLISLGVERGGHLLLSKLLMDDDAKVQVILWSPI